MHDVMEHWDALLPPGRVLHVPYEGLVAEQVSLMNHSSHRSSSDAGANFRAVSRTRQVNLKEVLSPAPVSV